MCKIYFFRRIQRHLGALYDLPTAFTISSHHYIRIRNAILRRRDSDIMRFVTDSFNQALVACVRRESQILTLRSRWDSPIVRLLFRVACDVLGQITWATLLTLSVSTPAKSLVGCVFYCISWVVEEVWGGLRSCLGLSGCQKCTQSLTIYVTAWLIGLWSWRNLLQKRRNFNYSSMFPHLRGFPKKRVLL